MYKLLVSELLIYQHTASHSLTPTWWKLKVSSHENLVTRVIWEGRLSNPIRMLQGNRQGALPSPSEYITLLADCLDILDQSSLGFHIGDISFVSPTCADDMLVLGRSEFELQLLLLLVVTYANEEHYTIHPDKSFVLPFNIQSKDQLHHYIETRPWQINNKSLPVVDEVTHVGVQRNLQSIDPAIETRISNGRQTMFSLLGCGVHGTNGLPVPTALHMYQIFAVPRVIYGLEALVLSRVHHTNLELFQRRILKSLLGVPQRTAIAALYIISGILPIEYLIDQRHLTFLRTLICEEGRLKNLVARQCIMKKESSKSWVAQIKKSIRHYALPCIPDLLESTPAKVAWKQTVKKAVVSEAKIDIEFEAKQKSTLLFLNPTFCHSKCHNVVCHIRNPREVSRAAIKTQMITGTYPLQTSKRKFKQSDSDICLICGGNKEDLTHMLLKCEPLEDVRQRYLPAIKNSIPYVYRHRNTVITSERLLTHYIMDHTHPVICELIELPPGYFEATEWLTRDFCYAVHIARSLKLDS